MIIIQKHLEVYGNIVKEIPAVNDDGDIINFNGTNDADSFNFKLNIIGKTAANNNDGNIAGRIDVELMVPQKYLSNFWRTFEMPLINCETELILTWSRNSVIISTNINDQIPIITITGKSLCSCHYFINSR